MERIIRHVDIDVYDVDNLYERLDAVQINTIVLSIDDRQFDIGALAYSIRNAVAGKAIRRVAPESYQKERAVSLLLWFRVNLEIFVSGGSAKTLESRLGYLIKALDSIDAKFDGETFLSERALNEAYQHYRTHLSERRHPDGSAYRATEAALSAWSKSMDSFCTALEYRKHPVEKIRIENSSSVKKATTSPPEEAIAESLALSYSIFDGICKLLDSKAPFPMRLSLPKESVWLFPARQFCATEYLLAANKVTLNRNVLWNYRLGRLNTLEEMLDLSAYKGADKSKNVYALRKERERALSRLRESNSDLQCVARRRLMKLAHDAYLTIFTAATGMNESVLRELEYNAEWENENFQGEKKEVGFRGVKGRANNKNVYFQMLVSQVKHFKRFIKLRRMIDVEAVCQYLFVSMNDKGDCSLSPVREHPIFRYYTSLNAFFYPELQAISFRQWRKYKSDVLEREVGVRMSAHNLQHTEETAKNSYMEQSDEVSRVQIAKFISLYDSGLSNNGRLHAVATPAGGCLKPDSPNAIPVVDTLEPDCRVFLGCLFCSNLLVHCSDVDIRKLVSMRFFVEQVLPLSKSYSEYKTTGGKTVDRINVFLEEIKSRSSGFASMVDRIIHEVYEFQALDTYWMSKLNFISKLDLL